MVPTVWIYFIQFGFWPPQLHHHLHPHRLRNCWFYVLVCCRLDEQTGELTMSAGAGKGDHVLRVNVEDHHWQMTVTSTVVLTVVYLNDTAVSTSASLRLAGAFLLNNNNLFNGPLSRSTLVSRYQKNIHSLTHTLSLWLLYNIFSTLSISYSP